MSEFIQTIAGLDFQEIVNAFFMALGGFVSFLAGLYTLSLLIPGEQPDKAIKWLLDITQRFSRK